MGDHLKRTTSKRGRESSSNSPTHSSQAKKVNKPSSSSNPRSSNFPSSSSASSTPNVRMIGEVHTNNEPSFQCVQESVDFIKKNNSSARVLVALEGDFDGIFEAKEEGYVPVVQTEGGGRRSQRQKSSTKSPTDIISQGVATNDRPIAELLDRLKSTGVLVAGVDKKADEVEMDNPERDKAMEEEIKKIVGRQNVTDVVVLAGSAHIADADDNDRRNKQRLGGRLKRWTGNEKTQFVNPYHENDRANYEAVNNDIKKQNDLGVTE